LPAYSEFMPPPRLVPRPYDEPGVQSPQQADDFARYITEYEEQQELASGLEQFAHDALCEFIRLGRGKPTPHIARDKLRDNPYRPASLAARAGQLRHERYVLLLSVALSRTQDDKGRVRWTLFGTSEQGPGRAFGRGFFTAPGVEVPWEKGRSFLAELLTRCYGVSPRASRDPAAAGLRVMQARNDGPLRHYNDGRCPPG
jgi:hypothetical protein